MWSMVATSTIYARQGCGVLSEPRELRVGSLFSGIGGFDLGFARAGMRTVWVVEQDPYCQFVLAERFPAATRYSDVRAVYSSYVEQVDVLCGGFPCQDISIAGNATRGQGINAGKSSIWSEFRRLIGEFRPLYVVIENSALLSIRGLDRVLSDLATFGYDAEWQCLSAESVGAPHIRERLYIVAYPHRDGPQGSEAGHEAVLSSEGWSRWRGGAVRSDWWSANTEPSRVDDGLSRRLDTDFIPRTKALGNALIPQIAEFIGCGIVRDYETQYNSARPSPATDTSLR
jgi:DNA (cytosine-5)-methyltransferase 1